MLKRLQSLFVLLALTLLPMQGWGAGMPALQAAAMACQTMAAPADTHCDSMPQKQHPDGQPAGDHAHSLCCQAQPLGSAAVTVPSLPLVSPQDSRHEVRYVSFVPQATAPPPRS